MEIYKIVNKINGHWYIGKHIGNNPNYMGSGKLLKLAQKKYGIENFEKTILETVSSVEQLNEREKFWITSTGAVNCLESYNLASGGEGGDMSAFIPYYKIDYSKHTMQGAHSWFLSLPASEKKAHFERQAMARSKGWYVSRVDDPSETYVHNISKWCEEHGVDKALPSRLNEPGHRLFQKQTKGWRIRRSDMPALPPYENKRGKNNSTACRGKTWKLVDGKRIWLDK